VDLTKASREEIISIREGIIDDLSKWLIEILDPDDLDDLIILVELSNDPGINPTIREIAKARYAN